MALFLALALVPAAMASTTWYVDGVNGNDGNDCKAPTTACKTIGHAIALASPRDSIRVAAATYTENLKVGFSLKIFGAGASKTIIDGGERGAVVSVFNQSSTTQAAISSVTITNGAAVNGAGISNLAFLTITDSVITGNQAADSICNPNFPCGSAGGGISNLGTVTIVGSTLTGNSAIAGCNLGVHCTGSQGAGIYNAGTITIDKSTITNNSAGTAQYPSGSGAAIYDQSYSTVANFTINNSTIEGNNVQGEGGAIYNLQDMLMISNSTVTDNTATGGQGGGILNLAGTTTVQNSIFASNTSGGNCSGSISSLGYNLSSDSTCNFTNTGDLNNTDPNLGPLQNNGGPTQTQALLPGSPAIDAGNPSGCTDGSGHLLKTDQRGAPRPDKEDISGCDMGAYERQTD